MQVFTTPHEMREWSRREQRAGHRVVAVPTMGALHEGHRSLMGIAAERGQRVVVSIFVNPLQFNQPADFDAYPQPIDADLAICREAGVHAVYAPTAATMYPTGFQTHVEPGELATTLEGESRPGHFRGVATVVTKLFGAIEPEEAIFGQKDFQQVAVVKRMVADLDLGVEIIVAPTMREPDGLAMSSRNRRLSEAGRRAARCIPEGFATALAMLANGERSRFWLADAVSHRIRREPGVKLDYAVMIDPDTLKPLKDFPGRGLIVVAAWVDGVRLIDNMLFEAPADAAVPAG